MRILLKSFFIVFLFASSFLCHAVDMLTVKKLRQRTINA